MFVIQAYCMVYGKYHGGYLDQMVEFYKREFVNDLRDISKIGINVSLQPPPIGYKDDDSWDEESAAHLIALLRVAPNIPRSLRRMANDLIVKTRRYTFQSSFDMFPSLAGKITNEFYYDMKDAAQIPEYKDSSDEEDGVKAPVDTDVIYISNPVEARLPSAHITVGLLKKILELRAEAARYLPTTKRRYTWNFTTKISTKGIDVNKTPSAGNTGGDGNATASTTGPTDSATPTETNDTPSSSSSSSSLNNTVA